MLIYLQIIKWRKNTKCINAMYNTLYFIKAYKHAVMIKVPIISKWSGTQSKTKCLQ